MESERCDVFKSPEKSSVAMNPQPSDQISSRTPKKLPHRPQRIKYHRHSRPLPEKYEILLRFFDALDASLKLLRFRKTMPVFSKIRVMVENMSERRFTHHHLAQLKFLMPEIGLRRVLIADEETHCMKYDLHVTLNVSRFTPAERRKQGNNRICLRDHIISQILEFVGENSEEPEIPEEELPEPFNQQKHDLLSKTFKQSSSSSCVLKDYGAPVELETARASHFPPSFRKHFSKGGSDEQSKNSRPVSSHQLPSISVLDSSADTNEVESVEAVALLPEMVLYRLPAGQINCKPLVDCEMLGQIKCQPLVDGETIGTNTTTKKKQGTPIKSAGTPIKPTTPSLQTPKKFRLNVDNRSVSSEFKTSDQPSCARSLQFENSSRSVNLELEDSECSNVIDILPENLLQSLKEKEEKALEMAKRKQMIKNLPKLFDRIYILFDNPKYSAIRKDALIRDLTECHSDITDESEVEEQFKLLQEIIPEWILCKLSPSGNVLYSINKALNPNKLRMTIDKAI